MRGASPLPTPTPTATILSLSPSQPGSGIQGETNPFYGRNHGMCVPPGFLDSRKSPRFCFSHFPNVHGYLLKGDCELVDLVTDHASDFTDHFPFVTDHMPIAFTDHVLTAYRPHTDHVPTTYRLHTDYISTTYRPHTDRLYLPRTDHISTYQLVHNYLAQMRTGHRL